MRELVSQIGRACDAGLYWVSLISALGLPDICGAMDSPNREASKDNYKKWWNRWVAPQYVVNAESSRMPGEVAYYYRCSMLHQGRATHPRMTYSRVLFIDPCVQGIYAHNAIIGGALSIHVGTFVSDILQGAGSWLTEVESTDAFKRNYDGFMRRHSAGLPPVHGIPVIG